MEFPPRPLGASLLHESYRERPRAGGVEEEEEEEEEDDEEEGGRGAGEEERAEREDGVLSAKCSLDREERTMRGKKSHSCFFFSNITVINM